MALLRLWMTSWMMAQQLKQRQTEDKRRGRAKRTKEWIIRGSAGQKMEGTVTGAGCWAMNSFRYRQHRVIGSVGCGPRPTSRDTRSFAQGGLGRDEGPQALANTGLK
ncbi:hypothetical protein TgHK011_000812 [Trichoderma gracile]|nr:hypothetical protein TgHK011_000812 [Trichoderma gracile]